MLSHSFVHNPAQKKSKTLNRRSGKIYSMKEQLQQIQAVAVVTFLCILISVNSTGDYGKWFVIDGARETVDPQTGNVTQYNTFQYHYQLYICLNFL